MNTNLKNEIEKILNRFYGENYAYTLLDELSALISTERNKTIDEVLGVLEIFYLDVESAENCEMIHDAMDRVEKLRVESIKLLREK